MTTKPNATGKLLGCVTLLMLFAGTSEGGGAMFFRAPGEPFRWPNGGRNVQFSVDQGGWGSLTNAEAVALTVAAFRAWQDVPLAAATFVNAGPLGFDVNETNFMTIHRGTAPDGVSPIIYDDDGAILDAIFGVGHASAGIAGLQWVDGTTGDILESFVILNGDLGPAPIEELLSLQMHEIGHFMNLDHSVVNGQVFFTGDQIGPGPLNTFPLPPFEELRRIETMYPFWASGLEAGIHADDAAIFAAIYPESAFAATTGAITGRIIAPNNTTLLSGINVIARNIDNPYADAVSAISGSFTRNQTPGAPYVGVYTLYGLTPGARYAIYVDQIEGGGFSAPLRPMPGPEEFYNGSDESSDASIDNPSAFVPVAITAGTPVSGIDIILARFNGVLPLLPEGSLEIFPNFPIHFCGQQFDSLFINGSGNLTFGEPGVESSGNTARLLNGPPRIAALWTLLFSYPDPERGSFVSYSETPDSFTFTFNAVADFIPRPPFIVGSNTFSITVDKADSTGDTIKRRNTRFRIAYGDVSAPNAIAGYSCGGRITSGFEVEQDLSWFSRGAIDGLGQAAVFEHFSSRDQDLGNVVLDFITPGDFRDPFEPNNAVAPSRQGGAGGRTVALPFNTSREHSDIAPVGDDVDVYRFHARAGDILVAETVPGRQGMDTLLGLFDAAGTLMAVDDDSGAGLLSRISFVVPADGTYAIAASTWPDFAFTGGGLDAGRYVLTIGTYQGEVLALDEDGSIEVPLSTFTFPFQGRAWSSVFVNANGNLTFGLGDESFSPNVGEFLNGPPRIAPLWDDLSPANFLTGVPQGLVIAEQRQRSLRVHFLGVPEFLSTGTNTFTVVLDDQGNVSVEYGATNRSDGLVGVTAGHGTADPGPLDLSREQHLPAAGTTYERFFGSIDTYGGLDLSFTKMVWKNR